MGRVLELLKDGKYWDETLSRMLRRRWISDEERVELEVISSEENRRRIIEGLGEYEWGIPDRVEIGKIGSKKKRVVYRYGIRDRYILGVLYRVYSEVYKDEVSERCYSYRRGVKTLNAIEYIKGDKGIFSKYGVKLDIQSYFNKINKGSLYRVIDEITEGESELRGLLSKIYKVDRVKERGVEVEEYKGMIPGVAFASFIANYSLKDIDRYVVEELGLTYARYSDDIIMFSGSEAKLRVVLSDIGEMLRCKGLEINSRKYEWYKPGDDIEYLGLEIKVGGEVDISKNSKRKIKGRIKHISKVSRREIEVKGRDVEVVLRGVIRRINYRLYKCYIEDNSKFGWGYYVFNNVNTDRGIREIDYYMRDRLRYIVTGVNNRGNIKRVSNEYLKRLGYISMVELYRRYKIDKDYYIDTIDMMEG